VNVPGFSADASLYKSRARYRTADQSGYDSGSAVTMAIRGGGFCIPRCGPCTSSLGFPTGCGQSCLTNTCDNKEQSCSGCSNPCWGGHFCGGKCKNTSSDPNNCGACGNVCAGGATCTNGVCACPPGLMNCNGTCVDTSSDPNNCSACGVTCSGSQVCCKGTCKGTVPAPAAGLSSNSNYFFSNNCQPIVGPTVALQVTQDMASDNGFSIQLNADSVSGPDAWQQYGFIIDGNSVKGFINNWTSDLTKIVCNAFDLCSTPLNNGLPAGYALRVNLTTDDSNNVTGGIYTVSDGNGNLLANKTMTVAEAGCHCGYFGTGWGDNCRGFRTGDLSPITTLTVDIVGRYNLETATFSGGAGNISYRVSGGQLTPLSSAPPCVEKNILTGELSNANYGLLSNCPGATVNQEFFRGAATSTKCFSTNGPCTGANGSPRCMTLNGVTQCCGSSFLWGHFPWIKGCSDGTVAAQGCGGPCW
jgi:hypothetical protein